MVLGLALFAQVALPDPPGGSEKRRTKVDMCGTISGSVVIGCPLEFHRNREIHDKQML